MLWFFSCYRDYTRPDTGEVQPSAFGGKYSALFKSRAVIVMSLHAPSRLVVSCFEGAPSPEFTLQQFVR